ncbi:MAG TPA: nucleotide sugar dehydrogenase [Chloroflexota bacterium]|nr:nucleotide sugar dehydrogenase [Chloroflexota bacterium]
MSSLIPEQLSTDSTACALAERIRTHQARIVVVGQGFVGIPEAIDLVDAGFSVIGVDIDPERVAELSLGHSPVPDVSDLRILEALRRSAYRVTTESEVIAEADIVIICAPTPLDGQQRADLTAVSTVTRTISQHLARPALVVLESTVPPGATRSVILPRLADGRRTIGRDVFLGFAPERIDPGNQAFQRTEVPRLVSGITESCRQLTELLYRQVVETVHPVSTPEVAELAKAVENSFRFINVSFVNEVAMLCDRLGFSVWEVIDAAASKPYAFLPHYPGPGIGGSCIPVVPHYLRQVAHDAGVSAGLLDAAVQVNEDMPRFVVDKLIRLLRERGRELANAGILVIGVSYKPNVADVRESPALPILRQLLQAEAKAEYHDPLVPRFCVDRVELQSVDLDSTRLAQADCVLLLTLHRQIDRCQLLSHSRLIFDTRNALKAGDCPNVVTL